MKNKNVRVSRILHAGYVFSAEQGYKNYDILFDPIFENPFSVNCYAYPHVSFDYAQIQKLTFSAIFISHYHDDHCSFESLKYIDRKTPIYIFCPFDDIVSLLNQLGFHEVYILKFDQHIQIGPFVITIHRALDQDVDCIFHLKAHDLNILNVVDSWVSDSALIQLQKIKWNLILWPFQNLREAEVISPQIAQATAPEYIGTICLEHIEQLKILNPQIIVPSSCQFIQESWSWYKKHFFSTSYAKFEKQIHEILPNTTVVKMNPSVSIQLSDDSYNPSTALPWVCPVGDQNVDYGYDPTYPITKTSQIAKKFPQLNIQETENVFHFCQFELLQIYNQLSPSDENYFDDKKNWKLSVFDHLGKKTCFYYLIQNQQITNLLSGSIPAQKPEWTTEIPIFKLHSAIYNGESLSSLYLRINDSMTGDQLKTSIKNIEITEDPLLRTLYYGQFASYQKAQLKKILS